MSHTLKTDAKLSKVQREILLNFLGLYRERETVDEYWGIHVDRVARVES